MDLYKCPIPTCTSFLKYNKGIYLDHFIRYHNNSIIQSKCHITGHSSRKSIRLLQFENHVFIIEFCSDWRHLMITLCSVERINTPLQYYIKLHGRENLPPIMTANKDIIDYAERLASYNLDTFATSFAWKEIESVLRSNKYFVEICFEEAAPKLQNNLSDEILRQLECPVCKNYFRPPIFLCIIGHSICGVCKNSLKICPLCESKYEYDTRNHAIEKIVREFLVLNCSNEIYGCLQKYRLEDIEEHEKTCDFRLIACPVIRETECKQKIPFRDFYTHINDKHQRFINSVLNKTIVVDMTKIFSQTFFFKSHNSVFRFDCSVLNKNITIRMGYLGDCKQKYSFTFNCNNELGNAKELKISEICYNIDVTGNDTNDSEGILEIPSSLLKLFVSPLSKLEFKISDLQRVD